MNRRNGLDRIQRAVHGAQTPAQILEVAIDQVLQVPWLGMQTSAAAFLMRRQQLRKVVSRNLPPAVDHNCAQLSLGHCLCGRVAQSGESIVCTHVDERHNDYKGMADHGHVVLPLTWQSQTLGVLNFYLAAGEEINEQRARFLEDVASIVAQALGRLTSKLNSAEVSENLRPWKSEKRKRRRT